MMTDARPTLATKGFGKWSCAAWWIGAVVFVGLVMIFIDKPVYDYIHRTFNYYTRPIPSHLKVATRVLRSMEDWGENVYILAVVFAMWQLDRSRRSRVLVIGLAALLVALAVEGVKRVTGRERPEVSKGELVFHGPFALEDQGDSQSFPSGHTAAAAAYSGALSAFYPAARPAFLALAIGCGGNRIWKERHFASDCLAGGLFGFWFAYTLSDRRMVQRMMGWFDRRFSEPNVQRATTRHSNHPAAPSGRLARQSSTPFCKSVGRTGWSGQE